MNSVGARIRSARRSRRSTTSGSRFGAGLPLLNKLLAGQLTASEVVGLIHLMIRDQPGAPPLKDLNEIVFEAGIVSWLSVIRDFLDNGLKTNDVPAKQDADAETDPGGTAAAAVSPADAAGVRVATVDAGCILGATLSELWAAIQGLQGGNTASSRRTCAPKPMTGCWPWLKPRSAQSRKATYERTADAGRLLVRSRRPRRNCARFDRAKQQVSEASQSRAQQQVSRLGDAWKGPTRPARRTPASPHRPRRPSRLKGCRVAGRQHHVAVQRRDGAGPDRRRRSPPACRRSWPRSASAVPLPLRQRPSRSSAASSCWRRARRRSRWPTRSEQRRDIQLAGAGE